MNIYITGASGYLGKLLTSYLSEKNNMVFAIPRKLLYGEINELALFIQDADILINLAGVSVLNRWTQRNKKRIYSSRITTTKNLVAAISFLPVQQRPKKVISASAIGIYSSSKIHDENSADFDTGFLGKLVNDWENTLLQLPDNIDITIFRIGMVLGREAKIIKTLKLPFKLGLGGKIGNGQQAFPFIHEKDLVRAFAWAIKKNKTGVLNAVAPEKITNGDFTKTLAKRLKRPAFIPVPGFALKMLYGKAASLLLESPVVEPKALLNGGFEFDFGTIDLALGEILK